MIYVRCDAGLPVQVQSSWVQVCRRPQAMLAMRGLPCTQRFINIP